MKINYSHALNEHPREGAIEAFNHIFVDKPPSSLLDVGCGIGTWLHAAAKAGVEDYLGVDGVELPADNLLFPAEYFRVFDLTSHWCLGRRFDWVMCLEVAEHLDAAHAGTLISSLTAHADNILFSAACPGQPGQHHVNCQWPEYWQHLFNLAGYACSDSIRGQLWEVGPINPWYRQNIFIARADPNHAGAEPRIRRLIHPEMLSYFKARWDAENREEVIRQIAAGSQNVSWYPRAALKAATSKITRFFSR
jgi:SAM-dependent methyltransferase